MTQRQTQRRLGLLQRHFSQQETIQVPAIGSSSILSDKIITKTYPKYIGSDTFDRAQDSTTSYNVDLTTCLPIVTRPDPMSDQASPATSYPLLDQAVSTMHDIELDQGVAIAAHAKNSHVLLGIAVIISLPLFIAIYLIWHSMASVSSPSLITQQNFSGTVPKVSSSKSSVTTNTTANSGGDIQVYIVGAVEHPGIYTLAASARVYQLLQAAGGPRPNANLLALNLAAKLNDGQEIYVTSIGESPPPDINGLSSTSLGSSSTGTSSNQSLVNINTASADELRQKLSLSSKSAQAIVSYRQQHGPFTSVAQLLQVVSKSIYDKIKNEVTV